MILFNNVQIAKIYTDGGCNNNDEANPNAYGGFKVFVGKKLVYKKRVDFPHVNTSNEAEYAALLRVFDYIGLQERRGRKAIWKIYMDSKLIILQTRGVWRVHTSNLKPFNKLAKAFLQTHKNVHLQWVSGIKMKEVLGH